MTQDKEDRLKGLEKRRDYAYSIYEDCANEIFKLFEELDKARVEGRKALEMYKKLVCEIINERR